MVRVSFLAAVFCAFVVADADAATNMYIKFEGPAIEGTATAEGHEKDIELLSWSHRSQLLTFTKYIDSASNSILKYCWSGKQFARVTITCDRNDGSTDNQPEKYLVVVMQNVFISNCSISGGRDDIPVEQVSLDYDTIKYDYFSQKVTNPPQSMTATPPLRAAAAPSCSVKFSGASSAVPLQSWNLTEGKGGSPALTFKARTDAKALQKAAAGGSATLTCGKSASVKLSDVKVSRVSNANGVADVTLTFGKVD